MAEFIAGKYYRTRDGRKAYVDHVVGPNPFTGEIGTSFPIRGYIGPPYSDDEFRWDEHGRSCKGGDNHDRDLIEEWREPRTASCKRDFVLVDCPRESPRIAARLEGNECSQCRIIGRKTVEVTITEGEGL